MLIAVFGTAVAMTMPIFTALVGAAGRGLALIGFLGQLIAVPQVAPTLGTMLGLAVGIDYSLFIISRHPAPAARTAWSRRSRRRARSRRPAARCVFAGSTVIVALLCLYFGGVDLVRSLGYAAALVVPSRWSLR